MLPVLLLLSALTPWSPLHADGQVEDPVVYDGFFAIEGESDKSAEVAGYKQYVKFYPGNRFIRLYIPYDYAATLTPETIAQAIENANASTSSKAAFIRDTFGVLKQKAIAHIDEFTQAGTEVVFDCGIAAPCRIEFGNDAMRITKKGIAKDHVFTYRHVP